MEPRRRPAGARLILCAEIIWDKPPQWEPPLRSSTPSAIHTTATSAPRSPPGITSRSLERGSTPKVIAAARKHRDIEGFAPRTPPLPRDKDGRDVKGEER